jgi:hypothetical protein
MPHQRLNVSLRFCASRQFLQTQRVKALYEAVKKYLTSSKNTDTLQLSAKTDTGLEARKTRRNNRAQQ